MRTRGTIVPTSAAGAVHRAKSAAAEGARVGCRYQLKYPNGGSDPTAQWPWDSEDRTLDCSGFVLWCLGLDRVQNSRLFPHNVDERVSTWFNESGVRVLRAPAYVNTDAICADASGAQRYFLDATKLPGGPAAGDLVVYPSYRNWYGRKTPGHVGLLTGRGMVAHCSASGKPAIKVTGPEIWLKRRGRGTMWVRSTHQVP